MRVHFFNTTLHGGAAIGAMRQFDSILRQNVEGTFYSRDANFESSDYATYNPWLHLGLGKKVFKWLAVRNHYRHIEAHTAKLRNVYEKFTPAQLPYVTPYPGQVPDIVHLHWISDWLDFPSFFASIPVHVPIVWSLHDMFPFTGGCHYNWGCEKFKTSCHHCPQLTFPAENDLSAKGFATKMKVFANRKLYVLANSNWMAQKAKESSLFVNARSIEALHLPIDAAMYRPMSKAECKTKLGIAPDTLVIAFGAERVSNYRKGFDLLIEALRHVDTGNKKVQVLYFGHQSIELEASSPLPVTALGFVSSGYRQAEVYNAADVFVVPSREEAFGQTALESIASGVPVVGFRVGGLPDVVINEETGLLAAETTALALADKLSRLLVDTKLRNQLGANGILHAKNNFDMINQGRKLSELYQKVLAES